MALDREEARRIARLAKLHLPEEVPVEPLLDPSAFESGESTHEPLA